MPSTFEKLNLKNYPTILVLNPPAGLREGQALEVQ